MKRQFILCVQAMKDEAQASDEERGERAATPRQSLMTIEQRWYQEDDLRTTDTKYSG